MVLTVLDLVPTSDAYAQQIGNDLKMYARDCRRGEAAWAYVDLLMLRHDMNQLGLFVGDLAMRQILQSEKGSCK